MSSPAPIRGAKDGGDVVRIVWLGGPNQGLPPPLNIAVVGAEYDVPDDTAQSLIDQGKAAVPAPKPEPVRETILTRRVLRPTVAEEE